MATGRGLTQLFGPGELFWEPSDVSGTSGTGLGYTRDGIRISPNFSTSKIRADEKGVELLKEIFAGCDWVLTAALIQWDANTIARLFPGLNISGGMKYSNSILLGSALSTGKLLYVPEDVTNVPAVYFRKASPHIEASAEILLALGDNPRPAVFPVVFTNASAQETTARDDTVQIRPLANIELT